MIALAIVAVALSFKTYNLHKEVAALTAASVADDIQLFALNGRITLLEQQIAALAAAKLQPTPEAAK